MREMSECDDRLNGGCRRGQRSVQRLGSSKAARAALNRTCLSRPVARNESPPVMNKRRMAIYICKGSWPESGCLAQSLGKGPKHFRIQLYRNSIAPSLTAAEAQDRDHVKINHCPHIIPRYLYHLWSVALIYSCTPKDTSVHVSEHGSRQPQVLDGDAHADGTDTQL